ncbi:unnamed protein product [Amoebophrya sp. A25]|nr:unnamed protein product [Amoebophrya sp. A25]|eukprot:GSA25T00025872001.1
MTLSHGGSHSATRALLSSKKIAVLSLLATPFAVPHLVVSALTPDEGEVAVAKMAKDKTEMTKGWREFLTKWSRPEYAEAVSLHSQNVFIPKAGAEALFEEKFLTFQNNVHSAHLRNLKTRAEYKQGKMQTNWLFLRKGKGKKESQSKNRNLPPFESRARFGVTKFMDYTDEDFEKYSMGLRLTEKDYEKASKLPRYKPSRELIKSSSRDWRAEGAVTPVKDQGHCGSCWAFATTETIESMALVQGLSEKANPFIGAPQELVSCDKSAVSPDKGCNGGSPMSALEYYKTKGLEAEKDFPYTSGGTGEDGVCKYDRSLAKYNVDEDHLVAMWGLGEDDMVSATLSEGPLSIAVYAMPWKTYTGGIMTPSQCGDEDVDHAVQAVGVDKDQGYWVVRNSWNSDWGEDGFIRLSLMENTCSLASLALQATVRKARG